MNNLIKKIAFFSILMVLFTACAEKAEEDTGSGTDSNVPSDPFDLPARLETIKSALSSIKADDDEFIELSSPVITNNKDQIIEDGLEFELSAETETNESLLISNDNIAFDIFTKVYSQDGQIKVWIKNPRKAGVYQVRVFYRKTNATGFFFLNITPGSISSLGELSGERFEDQNLNGQKDEDEFYSLLADNSYSYFNLGPILDSYGNLIEDGFIEWGFTDGNIVGSNPILISSGFASTILQTEEQNLTSSLTAVAQEKIGFNDLNFDGIQDEGEENIYENLSLTSSTDIKTVIPEINISCLDCSGVSEDTYDFGKIFLGQEESRTFTISNVGTTRLSNLFYSLTLPFSGVSGSASQCAQYSIPTDYCVCRDNRNLEPNDSCKIELSYTANTRSTSEGRLSITSSNSYEGANIAIDLEATGVKKPELEFSVGSIDFQSVAVGDTKRIELFVQNHGDVAANNVARNNPPPNQNEENSFYNILLPERDSVFDEDVNTISNCGNSFPPNSKKCRVYVDFTPLSNIENELLFGVITADDADSRLLIVKGSSFVNNYNPNIPVVLGDSSILADAVETSSLTIGPLLDIFGEAVSSVFIDINIDKGFIFGDTTFEDVVNGVYRARTDSEGKVSLNIKARERFQIGISNISVSTKDENDNILSSGSGQIAFDGAEVVIGGLVDFGNTELEVPIDRSVNIFNYGTIQADNIGLFIESAEFTVKNEGTCTGLTNSSLNISAGSSCQFEMTFTPSSETVFTSRLNLSTSSFGTAESVLLKGSGLVRAAISSNAEFEHFNLAPGQTISEIIIISNDGGEPVENLAVTPSAMSSAFIFSNNCETINPGETCDLSFTYSPTQIDKDITSIDLNIQGNGSIANTEVLTIPISFTYSNLTYGETPSIINKGVCSSAWTFKSLLNNDEVVAVSNILIDLYANVAGKFYSDETCTNQISKTQIAGGNSESSSFYFVAEEEGELRLSPLAKKIVVDAIPTIFSIDIFGDPDKLIYVSGNDQVSTLNQTLPIEFKVKVVDRNNLALRNIPITFEILAGNGTLSATEVLSSGIGEAAVSYDTGTVSGIHRIRAYASTINSPSEIIFEVLIRDKWLVEPLKVADGNPILWNFDSKDDLMVSMFADESDNGDNVYKVNFSRDKGNTIQSYNNPFMQAGNGNVMLSDSLKWYIYSPAVKILNNNKIFIAYLEYEENQIMLKGGYGDFNLAGNLQMAPTNANKTGNFKNSISEASDGIQRFDPQIVEHNNSIYVSVLNSNNEIEVYLSTDNGESFSTKKILKNFEGDIIETNQDYSYKLFVSNAQDTNKNHRVCLTHTRTNLLNNRLVVNCTEDFDTSTEEWFIESILDNGDGSNPAVLLSFAANTNENNSAVAYSILDDKKEARISIFNIFGNINSAQSFYLNPYSVSFAQGHFDETVKPLGYFFKRYLNKLSWYGENSLIAVMDYKTSEDLSKRESYLHKIPDINFVHTQKIDIPLQDLDGKSGDESQLFRLNNDNLMLAYKEFVGNIQFSNVEGNAYSREISPPMIQAITSINGRHGNLYLTPVSATINGVEFDDILNQNALGETSLSQFISSNGRFENGTLYLKSGKEYNFRNVTLLSGAKLVFEEDENIEWTKFLVQGDFINYGYIRAYSGVNDSLNELDVDTSFEGRDLVYTYPEANFGGNGGIFILPGTCHNLLLDKGYTSANNGVYLVDPDGDGEEYAPREVYCEFNDTISRGYTYYKDESAPSVTYLQSTNYSSLVSEEDGNKIYRFQTGGISGNTAKNIALRLVCPAGTRPEIKSLLFDDVEYTVLIGLGSSTTKIYSGNYSWNSAQKSCLDNKYQSLSSWKDINQIAITPTGDSGGGSACVLGGDSDDRNAFYNTAQSRRLDRINIYWKCY